ncbi:hypothetical protein NEHOM01_2287 [Nematocida homosporus]|uniref:uncharacterized protein n=1 Tax=Nematocida homosporus TaxID=1912981 RepID=UPI00221F8ABF|nr:uncharacterized protein NEHOM01_2287 [Nematocida homosporus]KAI5187581.1 hypothetical protein NEHOM01_2287 [Nematocida homosporus]
MNRYSLNVYQVVCLVIGLGCVWCSSDRKSDKMWLFGIFKRILLNLDSKMATGCVEITNAIDELKVLSENQTKQIDQIKQCQQNLEKEEQEASENMNSTQSDCSFSDKSKNLVEQKKINLISQLVREEVVQKSIDVFIRQLSEWLDECKNGLASEILQATGIDKMEKLLERLEQMKSRFMHIRKRLLELKRSEVEDELIIIGARCDSHELKRRFATIMVTELMKIRPNINRLDRNYLTQVMESKIDQFLINDEPKSPDNISRIIEEALVWLDGRSKEMEVKSESESEQKPTGSEPSNSRTQLSNPQTNESGMDGKLHSGRKSADQDSTSSSDSDIIQLSELDQKDCTLKLDPKQEKLLHKFISRSDQYVLEDETRPVWRMFDINEDNQSRKYGLSGIALQGRDWALLDFDWKESEVMKLLDVLKKFSKFILNTKSIWLQTPYNSAGWLVLSQLLTLFENPELSAMKKPLEILIFLPYRTCPSLESSFNDDKKREQFRNQIKEIEESRYIISMSIHELTSNVQEFIWPLATHLSMSAIGIFLPQMDKIDFLNDVNWIDRFTLKLELDYQKENTIVSLGARTAKGKDLPTCECLTIKTNLSVRDQPSNSPTKICVTGLTEYLQPNSFDEDGRPLNTLLQVSPDISTSP